VSLKQHSRQRFVVWHMWLTGKKLKEAKKGNPKSPVGLSRRRVPRHALLTTGSPLGTTGYHVGRGRRRQISSRPQVRGCGIVCRRRPWGRGRAAGCRRWLWGRGAPPDLVIGRGEGARRRHVGEEAHHWILLSAVMEGRATGCHRRLWGGGPPAVDLRTGRLHTSPRHRSSLLGREAASGGGEEG
jgi:hypothetical protein